MFKPTLKELYPKNFYQYFLPENLKDKSYITDNHVDLLKFIKDLGYNVPSQPDSKQFTNIVSITTNFLMMILLKNGRPNIKNLI